MAKRPDPNDSVDYRLLPSTITAFPPVKMPDNFKNEIEQRWAVLTEKAQTTIEAAQSCEKLGALEECRLNFVESLRELKMAVLFFFMSVNTYTNSRLPVDPEAAEARMLNLMAAREVLRNARQLVNEYENLNTELSKNAKDAFVKVCDGYNALGPIAPLDDSYSEQLSQVLRGQ